MNYQINGVELLQQTGKKHICIVNYSWKERRNSHLKSILEKDGFHVCFANDMDELMKLDINLHTASEKSKLKIGLRKLKAVLYFISGKIHAQSIIDAQDTLFLVSNSDTVICEAVQARLSEIGAMDRLFFYDARQNCILKYSKPVLNYMEYHVSWHCNLNCKGCDHYCNLYDQPQFGDPGKYRENLLRLHELFDTITTIRLMGGEPFLNPKLGEFARISREVFPHTDLRVVSNGLLIPKASDEVLEKLRLNHVTVDISNYPPTAKMLDKITNCLKNAGVPYVVSEEIREFQHIAGNKKKDGAYNFNHCRLRACHFLDDDGRLTVCGIPRFYHAAKDQLQSNNEVSPKNWIDIYSVRDGYEILREFNREIPFCTYCIIRPPVMFPWQGNYREELIEN